MVEFAQPMDHAAGHRRKARAPIEWVISREEAKLGHSLDYLRDIANASTSAFLKCSLLAPLVLRRPKITANVAATVRIAALQHEDCGTWLQIGVDQSLAQGADLGVVRATLARDVECLPPDLALVYRFVQAVVTSSKEANLLALRVEEMVGGTAALAEVALLIALARVFPTLKRALGHGVSCGDVPIVTAR